MNTNKFTWSHRYEYDLDGVYSIETDRPSQWHFSPDFLNVAQYPLNLLGRRDRDFRAANQANGHPEFKSNSPAGYTWHHRFNRGMGDNGDYIMQLAPRDLHRKSCPHIGAFKQGKDRHLYTPYEFDEDMERLAQKVVFKENNSDTDKIDEDVKEFQEVMARYIPKNLIKYYKKYDVIGNTSDTIYYKSSESQVYTISWFNPIIDGSNSILEILKYEKERSSGVSLIFYEEHNIPFAEDASGNIYYFKIKEYGPIDDAPIYFYDHEEDNSTMLEESFKEFESYWFYIPRI